MEIGYLFQKGKIKKSFKDFNKDRASAKINVDRTEITTTNNQVEALNGVF